MLSFAMLLACLGSIYTKVLSKEFEGDEEGLADVGGGGGGEGAEGCCLYSLASLPLH